MKKMIVVITQVLIFIGAWFVISPDQLVDNTYIFGLVGSVELVKGNADWVMMTAGILSVFNIWVWWPKVKVASISETSAKGIKSAKAEEAKAEETKDPIVPKMD